jgi:hypothetical protein
MVKAEGEVRQTQRTSNNETIRLNYNHKGLNLFAAVGYNNTRMRLHEQMDISVAAPDTFWNQHTEMVSDRLIAEYYTLTLGADYAINDRHSFGIKYDGEKQDLHARELSSSEIRANNI